MSGDRDLLQNPFFRNGGDPFHQDGESKEFSLYDYWRWMGSDLVMNVQRGVLAEYIVAKALEADTLKWPRSPWESNDVNLYEKDWPIEVKSSAHVQAWHRKNQKPTQVSFNIDTKKYGAGDYKYGRSFYVGAFVFCVLGEPSVPLVYPDPLDLAQWEFYVLMSEVMDKELKNQKTIRLRPLRELVERKGCKADFNGLRDAIKESFDLYALEGGTF